MTEPYDFAPQIAACLAHPDAPPPTLLDLVREVLAMPEACPLAKLLEIQRRIDADPLARRPIGLVYGGATKIKGYVFEAPKLPEIRGASALLDWVGEQGVNRIWRKYLPVAPPADTLHPAIIYAGGGSFLAFAPAELAPTLATAVEREYTTQTRTANSVAVAASFNLLELRYGRLYPNGRRGEPYWVERFLADCQDERKRAALLEYYYPPEGTTAQDTSDEALRRRFFNRKTFGELVTVLTTLFYRRREETASQRPGSCHSTSEDEFRHPPRYEMPAWAHKCTTSDVRPAVVAAPDLPDQPLLSEASARKAFLGRTLKRSRQPQRWFTDRFIWRPEPPPEPWEARFLRYVAGSPYAVACQNEDVQPAQDVGEIGQASRPGRYIGLIYADGNNVARYIGTAGTPQEYAARASALTRAALEAVFTALARHLRPARIVNEQGAPELVHPFEILTIGGDDLLLLVPGSKALDIALEIGLGFERSLGKTQLRELQDRYAGTTSGGHERYTPIVGLSAGVVIAQENTPVFFMHNLAEQLLKSAKDLARARARAGMDTGGAVDFMVLKSITMITDRVKTFRKQALGDDDASDGTMYRRTARPYTWHELEGLLRTTRALRRAEFPRSQLYRLRGVLDSAEESGVLVSSIEYLATRSRLSRYAGALLQHVEAPWRGLGTSPGVRSGAPPWLRTSRGWESIWPDVTEIYDLVESAGVGSPEEVENA